MKLPTAVEAAKIIGIPVLDWMFNCYAIATAFVEKGIVPDGMPVYGHYLGPINPEGVWRDRADLSFVRHGWIVLPNGDVVDPTRWCFEDCAPYIYKTTKALAAKDYDEGGNKLLAATKRPPPLGDPTEELLTVDLGDFTPFVRSLLRIPLVLPSNLYAFSQLFWLANLPYDVIGRVLPTLQVELKKARLAGLIPIDNQRRAEREYGSKHETT